MDIKKGKVSFLIPCYNHERFVRDCLASILAQTYTNYEVIICDDASKDNSVAVIKEEKVKFDDRDIRFILMENESNKGITVNLNRMLQEAAGEYIKIIASDDMLYPDYLEKMIKYMEDYKHLKMAFSNCMKVVSESTFPPAEECKAGKQFDSMPDCGEGAFEHIYLVNGIPAPALLIRHEIYNVVGAYDEAIGIEDLEMTLRILSYQPDALGGIDECLVFYRMNPNSITSTSKNPGAKKRMKFMHDNTVAIAKKYRKQVSKKVYKQRMRELTISYIYNRIHLMMDS